MRADYDPRVGNVEIVLESTDRLHGGEHVGSTMVHFRDGKPVILDVVGADLGDLRLVAQRYDLDAELLLAVARLALAAPNRPVSVEVGAPVA